jgi:hypothetical protein
MRYLSDYLDYILETVKSNTSQLYYSEKFRSLLKKIDTKEIKIPIIRKNKLKKFLNDYKTKVIFDKYINLFKFI